MSEHMIPVADWSKEWTEYEVNGETFYTPDDDTWPEDAQIVDKHHDCFFGRLSAPGFTDTTDHYGPFYTEDGALWDLYDRYGEENQTFFQFIGQGKKIEYRSLNVSGLNNELYGRAVGEGEIHLATLGPDWPEDLDPNNDPDLEEAYDFEIVQDDSLLLRAELTKARQRVLNAQRDSEFYLPIRVFWLWSDHSWSETTLKMPAEHPRWHRHAQAIETVQGQLEEKDRIMRQYGLGFDLPDLVLVDVIQTPEEAETPKDWIEWKDAQEDAPDQGE